jgi:8-oxo-dGTP pyrophosphatase MutT (NUDIX family)
MKSIIKFFGTVSFYITLPWWFFYLKDTKRSRVLLVANNTHILLVKAWYGKNIWSLPGGGIKSGEDPVLSATRELMEETAIGLGIDQLRPLPAKTHYTSGLKFDCEYFYAELNSRIRTSPKMPEIIETVWVPLADIEKYRLGADARHALTEWRNLLK